MCKEEMNIWRAYWNDGCECGFEPATSLEHAKVMIITWIRELVRENYTSTNEEWNAMIKETIFAVEKAIGDGDYKIVWEPSEEDLKVFGWVKREESTNEKENKNMMNNRKTIPENLKRMLGEFENLCECGKIRSYYDSYEDCEEYTPKEYKYNPSVLIYNFFSVGEEVAYQLQKGNVNIAEDLIRSFIKIEKED